MINQAKRWATAVLRISVLAISIIASNYFPVCRAEIAGSFTSPHREPIADYVPCMFSERERAEFKGKLSELEDSFHNFLTANGVQNMDRFSILGRSKASIEQSLNAELKDPAKRHEAQARLEQATAPNSAPDDVSCAMSIMTWDEVRDNFGRRVANQYVAFQVNVRNLNTQNEFLLHDVQIAVDQAAVRASSTSAQDSIGGGNRFVSARDKALVRAVGSVGQVKDPRNVAVRVAEAVGSIAASASLPAGPMFKDAANLFQGTAIPGFKSIAPDLTVEQLSRLDDSGFSTRANSRVIIPTRGSVNFVTFIPIGAVNERGFLESVYGNRVDSDKQVQKLVAASKHKAIATRMWPPEALAALQANSYLVVAGTHITEASKDDVAVTLIDCGQKNGALDTTTLKSGKCTLSGTNLHLISALVLKSATDSTDKSAARATVTTSGDPTSAQAEFKLDDLKALNGSYQFDWTNKSGTETGTQILVDIQGAPKDQTPGKVVKE